MHQNHQADPHETQTQARRAMLAGIGGLAAGALLAGKANAGPLNPPPGPISSTPGPEPRIAINSTNTPGSSQSSFVISQPGSYYLESNITGLSGRSGITIASSNVTIDLNGYSLIGVPGSVHGIRNSVLISNTTIRNGAIRSWGSAGVALNLLGVFNTFNCMIEHLILADNQSTGIWSNSQAIIRHCTAHNNGGFGFSLSNRSALLSSVSHGNALSGVRAADDCLIQSNVISNNKGQGVLIENGLRCTIQENKINNNNGGGIFAVSDGVISNNNIVNNRNASNQGAGIRVTGAGNRIEGNNIVLQAPGIQATGSGNLVIRNSLRANNPSFSLAGGNTTGPTVTSANIASSNNPHANYTF
ncbi:MAG: right-handed parallel beta-helix repeat-containing protein [Planctomycetes bacterium]|nr:right-handed parallel beta-helix repeat-containing protein [Planctomycetota bacterium]